MKNLVISDLVISDLRLPGKPRKSKDRNLNILKSAIPKRGAKISIFGFRQSKFCYSLLVFCLFS